MYGKGKIVIFQGLVTLHLTGSISGSEFATIAQDKRLLFTEMFFNRDDVKVTNLVGEM